MVRVMLGRGVMAMLILLGAQLARAVRVAPGVDAHLQPGSRRPPSMGKLRTPEEVAARKAKKEAKKEAKRAVLEAQEASSKKKNKKPGSEVARPASRKEIERILAKRVAKADGRPASLADRLNPKREHYDAELKRVWPQLTKRDKATLMDEDKSARAQARDRGDGPVVPAEFPFTPNANDHCETSPAAYRDIASLLALVAKRLGKAESELKIYDPYYCAGSMKRHLAKLGFTSVYNECEDFYARLAADEIPEHDVIVSNPPYSEDADGGSNHIKRLLRFCLRSEKPFLLNMPEYVLSAPYFAKTFAKYESPEPLLLCPYRRYHFWTPVGLRELSNKHAHHNPELGVRSSPFVSLWYVSLEPLVSHEKLLRRVLKGSLEHIDVAPDPEEPTDAAEVEAPPPRCRLCRNAGELPESRHTFRQGNLTEKERPSREQRAPKRRRHKRSAASAEALTGDQAASRATKRKGKLVSAGAQAAPRAAKRKAKVNGKVTEVGVEGRAKKKPKKSKEKAGA